MQILKHWGTCDASAALPLADNAFVVANDEDNVLRVYSNKESGHPLAEADISEYFDEKGETDIEGVSRIGAINYWITSHGRNKKGDYEKSRYYFFANKIRFSKNGLQHHKVGREYPHLLQDIVKDKKLDQYGFYHAQYLAPKETGGINIEGLSRTPEKNLLIGFRNPIIDNKAIVLPLLNPQGIIERSETALFDHPILLDLDGLGVRSIEYWEKRNFYLIVAGSHSRKSRYKLYSWTGERNTKPVLLSDLTGQLFNPESVIIYPELDKVQLLSDDGSEKRNGQKCKKLSASDNEKYFKSLWLSV